MPEISQLKNILIYRVGHLGDTIMALPAFWEIRKKFPGSKLTLLTNSDSTNKNYVAAKNVLPESGLFDSYICYDNSAQRIKKAINYARLWVEIRKKKFDGLFYLMPRVRTIGQIERDLKFFRAAGIKNIYGAEHLKKKRLDFKPNGSPLPTVEPEYRFLLDCLPFESAGKNTQIGHELLLTEREKKAAAGWLRKKCGDDFEKLKLIAVAPGSKWESKKWSEDRFVEVLQVLVEKYDVFPVVFGGGEDLSTGERILARLPKGANAAGELSIRESLAAIGFCELYVGNDTGTMHMAAAAGVPVVALFAAIDFPGRWYPFGERNEILRYRVKCEGCHTPVCFNDNLCLKLIEPAEVIRACAKFLQNERFE